MTWPLKSVELSTLTRDECITCLGDALTELHDMTLTADFSDEHEIAQYKANITFIKRYYEALERGFHEYQQRTGQ